MFDKIYVLLNNYLWFKDYSPFLFVLKQKRNQKIQGSIKFLTLINFENTQKITLNL